MVEITFQILMADLLIISGGLVTVPWCDVMIYITDWRENPVTWQKGVIMMIGMFFPLMLASLIAVLAYPEAFL